MQPFQGWNLSRFFPRVARWSGQPWAGGRNPFGIMRSNELRCSHGLVGRLNERTCSDERAISPWLQHDSLIEHLYSVRNAVIGLTLVARRAGR